MVSGAADGTVSPVRNGHTAMTSFWKQDDAFPIIAEIIKQAYRERQQWITHDEIVDRMLNDDEARKFVEAVQKKRQPKNHSLHIEAMTMVAWFSQRYTMGTSGYEREFDRNEKKIDGKYAYRPKKAATG